jgi:hypothetical protein
MPFRRAGRESRHAPAGWRFAGIEGSGHQRFSYQVMPNAAYRNADLPRRAMDNWSNGRRPRHSQLPVQLYGDENNLEPQRLLGALVRQLHAQPV